MPFKQKSTRAPARRWALPVGLSALGLCASAAAFVGFVTIAEREKVAVSIYNSEDLTLVRDTRRVVMRQGPNDLRYEWAGTLIDPTSLRPFAPAGVTLKDTTYPLNEGQSLVWRFNAARQVAGPLTLQYFTSGLSWRADHVAILTAPGKVRLETWVKVNNQSGEDYTGTHFRLVVGQVRLVERIRELAERFQQEAEGYGRRDAAKGVMYEMEEADEAMPMSTAMDGAATGGSYARAPVREKSVERESLSELHLYSIEGTESVPNGGARRMRAFKNDGVSVRDVYRCTPSEMTPAQRVLSFQNTEDNKLGTQPLPEGMLQLFRATPAGLTYEGRGDLPYTPKGEEAETPLGVTPGVVCKGLVKNVWKDDIEKDDLGRITGWRDVAKYEVTLINGAGSEAHFEMRQYHDTGFKTTLDGAAKEDIRTLLYKTTVPARGKKTLTYTVATPRGTLAEKEGK